MVAIDGAGTAVDSSGGNVWTYYNTPTSWYHFKDSAIADSTGGVTDGEVYIQSDSLVYD